MCWDQEQTGRADIPLGCSLGEKRVLSGTYSRTRWVCLTKKLVTEPQRLQHLVFLLWAGYWLNQSNIATKKSCFSYLLQWYWHSLLQKIRNQKGSVMDFTFHGIWEKVLGNFSVKEPDLSWLSAASLLMLLELLTKLNSEWHVCHGSHLCPDTPVYVMNYGSRLGIVGCSKDMLRKPLSLFPASDCLELWWLLQPQVWGSYSTEMWLGTASAKKVRRKHLHNLGQKFSFSKSSCGWVQDKCSLASLYDFPSALLCSLLPQS